MDVSQRNPSLFYLRLNSLDFFSNFKPIHFELCYTSVKFLSSSIPIKCGLSNGEDKLPTVHFDYCLEFVQMHQEI